MDINYFKKIRILDAGMGQELLARGLITKGTLWSATSLIDKQYYQLVIMMVYEKQHCTLSQEKLRRRYGRVGS